MNDLDRYATIFDGIRPWAGYVPKRFIADFLGQAECLGAGARR